MTYTSIRQIEDIKNRLNATTVCGGTPASKKNESEKMQKDGLNKIQIKMDQYITKRSKITNPYRKSILKMKIENEDMIYTTNKNNIRINKRIASDDEWVGQRICEKAKSVTRIWLQNLNGIDISNKFKHHMENMQYADRYEIDFFGFTETHLNQYNSYVIDNMEALHAILHNGSQMISANTYTGNTETKKVFGGVLSEVRGELAGKYCGGYRDRCGAYIYMDFMGKKKGLRIIVLYRVNYATEEMAGDNTSWMNQHLWLKKHKINTNPRLYVVEKIRTEIRNAQLQHMEVIVMGDINEDVMKDSGFNEEMNSLGLINMVDKCITAKNVRSFQRGSKIIDGMWGTQNVIHGFKGGGFAPFEFLFTSDHRGLYVDLDLEQILQTNSIQVTQIPYRRLQVSIPKRVLKYVEHVHDQWEKHKIRLKVNQICERLEQQGYSSENIKKCNDIDDEIQKILNNAEKCCCKVSRHDKNVFSVELKTVLKKARELKQKLYRQKRKYGMSDSTITLEKIRHTAMELREIKKKVKVAKQNDITLREQMLNEIADDKVKFYPGNETKTKFSIIKTIKHIEKQRRDAAKVRIVLKGKRSKRISHVLVPSKMQYDKEVQDIYDIENIWPRVQLHDNGKDINQWERCDDPTMVERLILGILKKHFQQAQGSIITSKEWREILMNKEYQERILNGTFVCKDGTPRELQEIIKSLKRAEGITEIPFRLSFQEFCSFIKKAKERTSTSPSNRHYGHYKALEMKGRRYLQDIFRLMHCSMKCGIVLERYKTTVTTVLLKEKIPYIHRLRPIHIIEAELQFISKSKWAREMLAYAESRNLITNSQYGGRRYRQAQSAVLNTVLYYDINYQTTTEYTSNDDDMRANFDREISVYAGCESRKIGMSYQSAKYMVDVTRLQKFYIKTSMGISDDYYKYTENQPIWGLGQGIGWAGSCWQVTASTIDICMKKSATGMKFTCPWNENTIEKIMDFFVDDTKKGCNTTKEGRTIMQQTQYNMQKHANYISSTGGALALDKCHFYHVTFTFDKNGDQQICESTNLTTEPLIIEDPYGTGNMVIKKLQPWEYHKTLGYYISPDGSSKKQSSELLKMANDWKQKVEYSNLSGADRILSFETVLRMQIRYRLVAISLEYNECERINKVIHPILLHAYGTHKKFPRILLESGDQYGGFKIRHFYDIHLFEKIKFFTYHIRANDDTGKLMITSMRYTQIQLGIRKMFLNTDFDIYGERSFPTWITHIWEYMSTRALEVDLNVRIVLPNQRKNDEMIMDVLN